MKKFIIKILYFISPLAIIFVVGDFILTSGLRKTDYSYFKEWNDIYDGEIKSNVIINGSSRAFVNVSPKIIDSILNVNSYNFGTNSLNFPLQYLKYKEYENYSTDIPEIIIQTLDVFTLQDRDELPDPIQFLPYIWHLDIRSTIKSYNKGFSLFEYFVPLIRYINNPDIAKVGFNEYFKLLSYKSNKYKGFLGMNRKWDGKFEKFKTKYPRGITRKLDSTIISLFDKYLFEYKQKGVMLFLVYPPEYSAGHSMTKNRTEIMQVYTKFSQKYGFPFLDYSTDSISYQKNLFYNSQHLNIKGAKLFSTKLAYDIKNIISE